VPTPFFIYSIKHNSKKDNLITKTLFRYNKTSILYKFTTITSEFTLLLSRFNNGPTPNCPMVMNDIQYNKTHLKTIEIVSFRQTPYSPKNTSKFTGIRGEKGGDIRKGQGRWLPWGEGCAHRYRGIHAPVRCHSKYIQQFFGIELILYIAGPAVWNRLPRTL
jgi:hypothetical protein